jgi:hypothetical protein
VNEASTISDHQKVWYQDQQKAHQESNNTGEWWQWEWGKIAKDYQLGTLRDCAKRKDVPNSITFDDIHISGHAIHQSVKSGRSVNEQDTLSRSLNRRTSPLSISILVNTPGTTQTQTEPSPTPQWIPVDILYQDGLSNDGKTRQRRSADTETPQKKDVASFWRSSGADISELTI